MTQRTKGEILAIFKSCDADGNGKIDKEEFVKGLSMIFDIDKLESAEAYKQFLLTIFDLCDKREWFNCFQRDGVLDLNEFERVVNAIPTDMNPNIKVNLGEMIFNIINEDGSKFIEKREMARFLRYSSFSDKKAAEFIKELDKDGDGQISLPEFLIWFQNLDH